MHNLLYTILNTQEFITLKNLRKNSYEIFSKFCKTNPIFLHFSPENEDSAKKQTQFKPNTKPIKPNFGPKTRVQSQNKPKFMGYI